MMRSSHFAPRLGTLAKVCATACALTAGSVALVTRARAQSGRAVPEPVVVWATDVEAEPIVEPVARALRRRSIEVRTLADLGDPPAPSETPASITAALTDAESRYSGAEVEEALAILVRIEPDVIARGDTSLLARFAAWRGACLAKLRRADEARSWLALAVRLGGTPDPRVFSPDVMALVPAASSLPTSDAEITVAGEPAGARIEIDGRPIDAATPTSVTTGSGLHLLVVRAAGRATLARVVTAPARIDDALGSLEGDALVGSLAIARTAGTLDLASPATASSLLVALGAARAYVVSRLGPGERRIVVHDRSGAVVGRETVREGGQPAIERAIARLLGERDPATPRVIRATRRTRPGTTRDEDEPTIFERWWFWGAVGLVVAGATVGGVAAATSGEDTFRVIVATPR